MEFLLVWPLGSIFKLNFVKNDMEGNDKMGGNVRLYSMPDDTLLGFYREQGGYMMWARIPDSNRIVYAYANPEDDDRFELMAAVRSPKSTQGRQDSVIIKDKRSGAVRTSMAEFLGVAYEAGQNRYMMGRAVHETEGP